MYRNIQNQTWGNDWARQNRKKLLKSRAHKRKKEQKNMKIVIHIIEEDKHVLKQCKHTVAEIGSHFVEATHEFEYGISHCKI